MMDVKNSQGRTVSLLNDELPRLSNLTSLSSTSSPLYFRHSSPQLQHQSSSSSSRSSTSSARSSNASLHPYSPSSNPPSLSRSDSSESGANHTPSPLTPASNGFDNLRELRRTLPGRKFSSSLEGLPSLSTLRQQAKLPPARTSMDFNQTIPNDFQFTSQPLYDPLVAAPAQLTPVTSVGLEQTMAVPTQKPTVPNATQAPAVFPTPITTPKSSTKKNHYPCPLAKQYQCVEHFTTSGHAARHAKKHTGKKDAICPECGKGFTRKDNMEQHRRTHSGGRNKSNSTSESSSSSKPAPSKDSEETKARQKARQQQRKSRPSSISTAAPPPPPPQPMPTMPTMQQPLPMTITSTLPPQGDLLDPALREQTMNGFYSPTTDLGMGFGFPMPQGQMQGFPASQAPMSLMSSSRARGSVSPQGVSPQSMKPLSPSAAPLTGGMDKLDILAEASSRRSSE